MCKFSKDIHHLYHYSFLIFKYCFLLIYNCNKYFWIPKFKNLADPPSKNRHYYLKCSYMSL